MRWWGRGTSTWCGAVFAAAALAALAGPAGTARAQASGSISLVITVQEVFELEVPPGPVSFASAPDEPAQGTATLRVRANAPWALFVSSTQPHPTCEGKVASGAVRWRVGAEQAVPLSATPQQVASGAGLQEQSVTVTFVFTPSLSDAPGLYGTTADFTVTRPQVP